MSARVCLSVVFNPKARLTKDGRGDVCVKATNEGRRIFIPTGVKVRAEQWDKRRERVKLDTPNALAKNNLITELLSKVEAYTIEQISKGRAPSLEGIREYVKPKEEYGDFVQFFEKFVKSYRDVKEGTRKSYQSTIKHLKSYRRRIAFDELDYTLIRGFELYLRERVGVNSAGKYLKNVRAVINQGVRMGVIGKDVNPFRGYRIPNEPSEPKYLLPKDIQAIEALNLEDEKPALRYVRDMYLFAVYTGLRISDTTTITPRDIQEVGGNVFLVIDRMQKTSRGVRLPLNALGGGKPLEILARYHQGEGVPYFGAYTHQFVSRELKRIAELAGITKRLTFHTARHTNATDLMNRGVPLSVVQNVLGHTKQSTTEIYAKMLGVTMLQELKKAFKE